MHIVWQSFAQPVQRPAAHRYLAARVIDQAFRDVRNPNGAPTDSASAREFLSGSPMLSYWCEVAELDLKCVICPGTDSDGWLRRWPARPRRSAEVH